MARFLLDANLSPKVGRFLARQVHVDVVSLQGLGLGQLPDHEVIRMDMARSTGRVINTQDRNFAEYFARVELPRVGIIYLDLPNSRRTIPGINRVLDLFFRDHAASIDLEHALVTITEHDVRIHLG